MNCTQNKKIEQVKETTMIVGIDVGSEKHYFRAFNWRGIELTRKPIAFSNSMEGFNSFYNTIVELMQKSELEEALVYSYSLSPVCIVKRLRHKGFILRV